MIYKFQSVIFKIVRPTHKEPETNLPAIRNHPYYNLYVLSTSWYSLIGLVILPKYRLTGRMLLLQGLISYLSDVSTLGKTSMWHPIDRFWASSLTMVHFVNMVRLDRVRKIINLLLILVGFDNLHKSQECYSNHDPRFLWYHTKWHMVVPLMLLTYIY